MISRFAGLWTLALASSAVLATAHQAGEPTPTRPACDCRKDCGNVEVVWWSAGDAGAGVTAEFEQTVLDALKNAANWKLTVNTAEPRSIPPPGEAADDVRLHLVSCRSAECRSRFEGPGNETLEILNARMLVRPLYIFLREGLDLNRQSPVRVAIATEPKGRTELTTLLPVEEIEHFLSEILNTPVSLRTFPRIDELAAALANPQRPTDIAVLFGEEPFPEMEDLRASYAEDSSGSTLQLLAAFKGSFNSLRPAEEARIRYTLLEYPRDAFYRDLRTFTGGARVATIVGVAALHPTPSEPSLPALITNSKPLADSGRLPSCCLQALRRAVGGAALLMARPRGTPDDPTVRLERTLLTYALLSSRGEGEPALAQLLSAGALAGHLKARGDSSSKSSAQAVLLSVAQDNYDAMAKAVEREMTALDPSSRRRVRDQFSRDVAGLVAGVPQTREATLTVNSERLHDAVGRLLVALSAEPSPARRKGGAGMTHAENYNPYLDLAQFWMLHRSELTAQGPVARGQVATARDGAPGTRFLLVATVIGLEAMTLGGPWSEALSMTTSPGSQQ